MNVYKFKSSALLKQDKGHYTYLELFHAQNWGLLQTCTCTDEVRVE